MKLSIFLFSLVVLGSCSTGMKIPKSQIQKMGDNFSGSFFNKATTVSDETEHNTLTSIFEIDEVDLETITLTILDSTSIELSSNINGLKKAWNFQGGFSEKGYFEVYIRNNYEKGIKSFADIKRIRFTKSVQGNLLVDDYKRNERQFLLWRVGGRYRIQSEFQAQ